MPKLLKLPRKLSLLFKAPLLPNTPPQLPLKKSLPHAKAPKPLKRQLKRLLKYQTEQLGKILPIADKPSLKVDVCRGDFPKFSQPRS